MKRHRLLLPLSCLLLANWALPASAGPREQLEGVTIKTTAGTFTTLSNYLKTVQTHARKALGAAAPEIRLELPAATQFMKAIFGGGPFGGGMPGGRDVMETAGLFTIKLPAKERSAWGALQEAAAIYDLEVVVRGKSVLLVDSAEVEHVRSYPCSPELYQSLNRLRLVRTYSGDGNASGLGGFVPTISMKPQLERTYDQNSQTLIVTAKREILALFELSFLALQRAENGGAADAETTPGQAILHTRKGSTLAGTLKAERLILKTTLGQLEVPLARFEAIWFDAAGQTICHLRNGDRIQAELAVDALSMDTEFGVMAIPVATCRVLRFGAPFVPQGKNSKVQKELHKFVGGGGHGGVLIEEMPMEAVPQPGWNSLPPDFFENNAAPQPNAKPVPVDPFDKDF